MYRRMRALARRRCKHGETSIDPTHDCEEEEKPMPYQVEPAPGESAQCSGPRGRHPIRIPARALHPGQSESTAQHKGRIDTCNLYLRAGVNLLLANWVESIDTSPFSRPRDKLKTRRLPPFSFRCRSREGGNPC